MAEGSIKKTVPKEIKKAKEKKTPAKKISISFEKEYYQELSNYAAQKGITVEEFAKKAVQEKYDSDRISNMIDFMSSR